MDPWDIHSDEEAPPAPIAGEPSDVRLIRRGVVTLRACALAVVIIAGLAFANNVRADRFDSDTSTLDRTLAALELFGTHLGIAGLVFAGSVLAQVQLARLQRDTSVGAQSKPSRRPNAGGDLVIHAPPRAAPASSDDSIWKPQDVPSDSTL